MIKIITAAGYRLDRWLHERLGRPYKVLLTVGLVADIGQRIVDAPKHISSRPHLIGTALAIVMELGLLIHQLAEMDERLGFRGETGTPTSV